MSEQESERGIPDRWLAAELSRMWLIAERTLRTLQRAQVRPQTGHPAIAEVEAILTARRHARLGPGAQPEDEAALTRAIAAAEAELIPLRNQAPIGHVIETLGLRPLEIETLVTAMAPHVDAPLTDIFSVLRGASTVRRGVDLALIVQLFRLRRADRIDLIDALDPDRPLLLWRLLRVVSADFVESYGSLSHRALSPTLDLLSILLGRGQLAPELARYAKILPPGPTPDQLRLDPAMRSTVDALCVAARSDRANPAETVPWLVLYGPAGIGKKTFAACYAGAGGRPLVVFEPMSLDKGQFDEIFPRVQREALIRGACLYIGPLGQDLLANGGRELVRRLRTHIGPLILGTDEFTAPRITAEHPILEVGLKLPSEPTRVQLWRDHLPARCAPDLDVTQLARAFQLTPGEIKRTAAEAVALARREARPVTHADVRGGVDRRLRNDLGELARRIEVVVSWDDLVLPPEDMARVQEFISRRKYADLVYQQWGYGQRVGYGKGLIALFSGPPGTGKTMLAGLIARALDLDIYQVDLAQIVSKWVGETEKSLGKVFDQAERAHAVLLFDEADSLFAKRTEVKGANDRYANMATNYLLQRLEAYHGVAVLTSNKEASLDEALQRRLTLHLRLEIPEIPERERLWQSFLPSNAPVVDDVDLRQLATEFELSGGYIKNAAVRAAFLAASHDAPIGMEVLRLASALELEDMGRVVLRRREVESAEGAQPSN